ncbi:ABC transporter permease [Methylocapsa sp. S129]|uniref:ABC transporter permease n=1 Tax=Methylocapsa sp. S129 TaxID=1641869 RepID=UPI00131CA7C7|nr:ABC transporter permease [Methylocapsa sp. S129]
MSNDGTRRWRILRGAVCVFVAIYLLAPLAVVLIISFSAAPFLQFPPPGLSLRWYEQLFTTPAWTDSLLVSVEILVPSSILATVMGTAAAHALVRGRVPGASLIMACLMLPIVVPGMITAAALFGVYRGLGLNGTLTGLIIGHTVLSLPYVVATVASSLRVQDERLEQAASTLGAPPWATFRRITLPLVLPAVLSALLFAMILSFDELIVSLFVSSARVRPVAVQMWSNLMGDFDPTIAAIASICFLAALIVLLADLALRGRRGPRLT